MSIILSILALGLMCIVHAVYSIFIMLNKVRRVKWYKKVDKTNFNLAFNIDVFANYQYRSFWNWLLSKRGYEFGVFGETLSSVLGKKQIERSLSITGWILLTIINIIDFSTWFKGGHCKDAIITEYYGLK